MWPNIFTEIASVLAVAVAVGAIGLWLRQPLIISFIVVGILVGPIGFDWVHAHDQLDLFAELGIGLLLFIVGLKLDPALVRSAGLVSVGVGLAQMAITAVLGYLLALMLGIGGLSAFYVAAAVTFSSTIIIVKLLADKREIDSLHGRISLGILIMQDIAVIILMIAIIAFGEPAGEADFAIEMLKLVGSATGFLVGVFLVTRFLLPRLLDLVARSPELLVLFGIAWAIGLASLAEVLDFSKEVGAFVGGVALAGTPYRPTLAARLVNVRDFLLLFFFIDLGLQINVAQLAEQIGAVSLLSLFAIVGKPLIIIGLIAAMGYPSRISGLTGLSLGQISEFSLILAALGFRLGHIDASTVALITAVGILTIGASTYVILYSHRLYEWMAPWIDKLVVSKGAFAEPPSGLKVDVIVFGLGRYGRNVAQELQQRGLQVLGVDFDPEVVKIRGREGLSTLYGDIEDAELFSALPLEDAQWVVSTIAERDRSLVLLHSLRHHAYAGRVAITAHTIREKDSWISAGADLVLLPFRDAAREVADNLTGAKQNARDE
ncbi:MAG: cation:proton antiporter [Gammaproteobacteria bacterium]|nr:cation:proton antiporter [Gammaproteobacteria bacterium]